MADKKLGLSSDFRDYYDHAFDVPWDSLIPMLDRKMNSGPPKLDQLKLMGNCGIPVPQINPGGLSPETQVVVITDERAHCGEGKLKVSYAEAREAYYGCPYLEFIASGVGALTYRFLKIGSRRLILRYKSKHPWMSNVGDVSITLVGEESETVRKFLSHHEPLDVYPLYAIDFVPRDFTELVAVDFNVSPGIKGTPVQEILKPMEVYDLIKEAYFKKEPKPQ